MSAHSSSRSDLSSQSNDPKRLQLVITSIPSAPPSPSKDNRSISSGKRSSSIARTYQTPLRGNTTDEDDRNDADEDDADDDDDALSWKSAQGHINPDWEDEDLTPPRVRKRSTRSLINHLHNVARKRDSKALPSQQDVELILHATPISLAEENRQLKEELAAFKQEHKRLMEAERVLKQRQKKLNGQLTILQELSKNKVDAYGKIVTNLNTALQCQICLEPLCLPYALAPCGHVGCFDCLRSWFTRTVNETEDAPPIHPKKTCPHCRTEISIRPVPLFILKNIVQDVTDATKSMNNPSAPPEPTINFVSDVDPWQGIFHSSCPCCSNQHSGDEDGTFESTEDDLTDTDEDEDGFGLEVDSSSDENIDDSEGLDGEEDGEPGVAITPEQFVGWQRRARDAHMGPWAAPRWSHPLYWIPPEEYLPLSRPDHGGQLPGIISSQDELRNLLARGAPHSMIRKYFLTYNDEWGIVAVAQTLPRLNPRIDGVSESALPTVEDGRVWINLGWRLYLHPVDFNGNVFMDAVLDEWRLHPDRYQVSEGYPGLPLHDGEIVWIRREPVEEVSANVDDQESAEEFAPAGSWIS